MTRTNSRSCCWSARPQLCREARDSDVGAQLLGREAGEGVHLLQLLDRKYAVVATNPPYMGSEMNPGLRGYIENFHR